MKKTLYLKDLKQLRALADPLRVRILTLLRERAMTTKQVAEALRENATKLYRHVYALEEVGLITLVQTRKKRGTVEKYFRAMARDIQVDQRLFQDVPPKVASETAFKLVNSLLQTTASEITHTLQRRSGRRSGKRQAITLYREQIKTTPQAVNTLKASLKTWVAQFTAAHNDAGPEDHRLTIVMYSYNPESNTPGGNT